MRRSTAHWLKDEDEVLMRFLNENRYRRISKTELDAISSDIKTLTGRERTRRSLSVRLCELRKKTRYGLDGSPLSAPSSGTTSPVDRPLKPLTPAAFIARLAHEIKAFVDAYTEENNNLRQEVVELKGQLRSLTEVRSAVEQYQQKVLGKKVLRIT